MWEVAARPPAPELAPYLVRAIGAWTQSRGAGASLREVPFPGVPLILNLGAPWTVDGQVRDSFVAGLHDRPALVESAGSHSCIELRLTPLAARRLLGLPMHELANRAVALEDVLPRGEELTHRLREAPSWEARFDLAEDSLRSALDVGPPPSAAVAWAWRRLLRSGGREPVGRLAAELGWSRRRLIARFREEVGLPPKTAARVIRFDRSVARLRAGGELGAIAHGCGYYDQAHFNREFRELAGTTPSAFRAASSASGAVAA